MFADRQIEIVANDKAENIATELQDQFRYFQGALVDLQKATEQAIEYSTKQHYIDSKWITNYATKAAEYEQEIKTLVRMAKLVGLTTAQIELALSGEKVWFLTAEEAEKYTK